MLYRLRGAPLLPHRDRHNFLTVCVRFVACSRTPQLLGLENDDIDIALDDMKGQPFAEYVNRYLVEVKNERAHTVGVIKANPAQSKHLETATVKIHGVWIDFVNLRCEEYTESSRIPTMKFGTPVDDAKRRDFTINSLFYNVNAAVVEDFTGLGVADLRAGFVRTPLPPQQTFLDDPLRVLRAIRFSSRYRFELDPAIVAAARDPRVQSALQTMVSRERVGTELGKMMKGKHPMQAIHYVQTLRLFDIVFMRPASMSPTSEEAFSAVPTPIQLTEMMDSLLQATNPDDALRATSDSGDSTAGGAGGAGGEGIEAGDGGGRVAADATVSSADGVAAMPGGDVGSDARPPAIKRPREGSTEEGDAGQRLQPPPPVTAGGAGLKTVVERPEDATSGASREEGGSRLGAAQWDDRDRKLLMLAAATMPWAGETYLGKKKKKLPMAEYCFREGLRLPMKDVNDIGALHKGALRFLELEPAPDRLALGLLIRELGQRWPFALLLAKTVELCKVAADQDVDIGHEVSVAELRDLPAYATVETRFAALRRQIEEWRIERAYKMCPLMNGKELMKALSMKKGGKLLGALLAKQTEWQILNPDGTAAEVVPVLCEALASMS